MDLIIKLIKWVEKHKVKSLLYVVALFILSVLIVQVPYWIGSVCPYSIKTDFSASAVLGYLGSFLSFIGTVALGILALWQNHIIQQQSKIEQEKLTEIELNKTRPQFFLSLCSYYGNFSNPEFELINKGNGSAYDVIVSDIDDYNDAEYKLIEIHKPLNFQYYDLNSPQRIKYELAEIKETHCLKFCFGLKIVYYDINAIKRKTIMKIKYEVTENGEITKSNREENTVKVY